MATLSASAEPTCVNFSRNLNIQNLQQECQLLQVQPHCNMKELLLIFTLELIEPGNWPDSACVESWLDILGGILGTILSEAIQSGTILHVRNVLLSFPWRFPSSCRPVIPTFPILTWPHLTVESKEKRLSPEREREAEEQPCPGRVSKSTRPHFETFPKLNVLKTCVRST